MILEEIDLCCRIDFHVKLRTFAKLNSSYTHTHTHTHTSGFICTVTSYEIPMSFRMFQLFIFVSIYHTVIIIHIIIQFFYYNLVNVTKEQ
jgi:hypothetical protein